MKYLPFYLLIPFFTLGIPSIFSQNIKILKQNEQIQITISQGNKTLLSSPSEGLWSIATSWENEWPSKWQHVHPDTILKDGKWTILRGTLNLPEGKFLLKDSYIEEGEKVKCIRRYEWQGKKTLETVTLAIRWAIPQKEVKPFLPGIIYYGNPSGKKNGENNVPWLNGVGKEEALFEEHRFPMPFASAEWEENAAYYGATLHVIPSPIYRGNHFDQWWSLGLITKEKHTELTLLSGPVGYNGQRNQVKALQEKGLPYANTYIKVTPGTIIEKTYYLETYNVPEKGAGFQQPMKTSVELFKPFYTDDLPRYEDIISQKIKFARSRWVQQKDYAGFNMYPDYRNPQIVLGWAGQGEAPGFALQKLGKYSPDESFTNMVQSSLDHICTSPIDSNGFCVIYDIKTGKWRGKDPVSQGQAMNSIALAILEGRKNKELNTLLWENFLLKAAEVFSNRILKPNWTPVNTAEAFFIAPLITASTIFNNEKYGRAALKAADYYAGRHLDMDEPYWGGTLDATCEDKEGAWGAFQGFLAAFEFTKNTKYLKWAKHACDVTLSYTVVWDIPLPAGRLADHRFRTRGWTGVSAQNQHLDVYGVVFAPSVYKMGIYLADENLKKLAKTMFLSCGQMIDPSGSQGEQFQETNFAQHGDMSDVMKLRGGYSERWTVFWICAHFLHAAAQFEQIGIYLD
ncbi:MAG: hypothetical protein ACK5ZX_01790 [Bacteroidota bacterium]